MSDENEPGPEAAESDDGETEPGAGKPSPLPLRRRLLPVLLGGAALAVIVGAVAWLLLSDGEEPTYTAETRDAFLVACTGDGGEAVRPVCECFYEAIVDDIPYDRYRDVNEQLLAARPAEDAGGLELPDDFEALLDACRRVDLAGETD